MSTALGNVYASAYNSSKLNEVDSIVSSNFRIQTANQLQKSSLLDGCISTYIENKCHFDRIDSAEIQKAPGSDGYNLFNETNFNERFNNLMPRQICFGINFYDPSANPPLIQFVNATGDALLPVFSSFVIKGTYQESTALTSGVVYATYDAPTTTHTLTFVPAILAPVSILSVELTISDNIIDFAAVPP